MPRDKSNPGGLVDAFQHLTDGLVTLLGQHLQLFGLELKHDARVAGRYAGAMAFFVAIALVGYVFLNLAAILFAGIAAGLLGMASSALVLAVINLGFAGKAMFLTVEGMKGSDLGPRIAGGELNRSRAWAKQIQERTSSL